MTETRISMTLFLPSLQPQADTGPSIELLRPSPSCSMGAWLLASCRLLIKLHHRVEEGACVQHHDNPDYLGGHVKVVEETLRCAAKPTSQQSRNSSGVTMVAAARSRA
jgi:hypothetical protein